MIKVAFPTEDGETISRHFGRAPFYLVAAVQQLEPTTFEQRGKVFHGSGAGQHDHEGGPHGHSSMFAAISDCQVLIAGGMGQPAFDSAIANGFQVILTGETTIQCALDLYIAGELQSDARRIHRPHMHD